MKRILLLAALILGVYAFGPSHRHVQHFTETIKGKSVDVWIWGDWRGPIGVSAAYSRIQFVVTTGTSTFAVNSDWNDADNSLECVGSGGNGGGGTNSQGGGGGGAYSVATNVNLPEGSNVDAQVGAGGGTTLTWLKDAVGGTIKVQCDYGRTNSGSTGGAGGAVANNIPVSAGFAGGTGGNGVTGSGKHTGGGGAGAGGPSGAGSNGSNGTGASSNGGAGGNANGGTELGGNGATTSSAAGAGQSGTEWQVSPTRGPGAGGGGGADATNVNGAVGANFGAGGAGCGDSSGTTKAGAQGLIIISDNPSSGAAVCKMGLLGVGC